MKQVLTPEWVGEKLPKRPKDSHKGVFGKVLVFAGSENYPGAAYLASAAAYRTGAGQVTLATAESVKIIVSRKLPEATFLSENEAIEKIRQYDALLLGPGLGQAKEKKVLLEEVLKNILPPVVIDADALNLLSQIKGWSKQIRGQTILTPHPGEMARLTDRSIKEIQRNRIDVAQYFARKWGVALALKGAKTVIVSPAGEVLLSPFINPLLATAGTGDVLSGIIAGLMAQGLNGFDAAGAGVYVHGTSAESLRGRIGEAGLLAGDLLLQIPLALKKLR